MLLYCRLVMQQLECGGRYLTEAEEGQRRVRFAGGLPLLVQAFAAANSPELQVLTSKCIFNLARSAGEPLFHGLRLLYQPQMHCNALCDMHME